MNIITVLYLSVSLFSLAGEKSCVCVWEKSAKHWDLCFALSSSTDLQKAQVLG